MWLLYFFFSTLCLHHVFRANVPLWCFECCDVCTHANEWNNTAAWYAIHIFTIATKLLSVVPQPAPIRTIVSNLTNFHMRVIYPRTSHSNAFDVVVAVESKRFHTHGQHGIRVYRTRHMQKRKFSDAQLVFCLFGLTCAYVFSSTYFRWILFL